MLGRLRLDGVWLSSGHRPDGVQRCNPFQNFADGEKQCARSIQRCEFLLDRLFRHAKLGTEFVSEDKNDLSGVGQAYADQMDVDSFQDAIFSADKNDSSMEPGEAAAAQEPKPALLGKEQHSKAGIIHVAGAS